MVKVVCIVQARLGSTRLPRKVMHKINGKPILGHCLSRLKKAKQIDEIVVATTDLQEDKIIENYTKEVGGISVFRGDADDVLSRYRQCSDRHKADIIIRATADNPLVDPQLVDKAVLLFLEHSVDYCSNKIKPSYPMGFDIEVFSANVLALIDNETSDIYDREHVTPPILKQSDRFSLLNFASKEDNSDLRVTVDYKSDLDLINSILLNFSGNEEFTCNQVVEFLKKNKLLINYDDAVLSDMKKKRNEYR